jgi:glutamate-5-semialdehyde dehydrogenase
MSRSINLVEMGKNGKAACKEMARASTDKRNEALDAISNNLLKYKNEILAANDKDILEAKAFGMDDAMLDRLILNGRLEGIAEDTKKLVKLPDPIGKIIETKTLENGLKLSKRRTPIGMLGVIYESRPNVTIDISALTIKTGNCVILRGGSETLNSNLALIKVIHHSLEEAKLPKNAVQFINSSDRDLVTKLLQLHEYVDLIIPRGGAGLHQYCRDHSKIPVITGGIGICHLFVDSSADIKKTIEVIHNAKTQRPTVCNALDTILVHAEIAEDIIPKIVERLIASRVKFRMDPRAMKLIQATSATHVNSCELAQEKDWDTEWLSLVLGIKIVDNLEDAISHIQEHSSGHSDGILSENRVNAKTFIDEIDSSSVYVNASTRFTDGGQFGLGAEVAISTQKLHARGPMGLEELTTYKWVVEGNYHIRK